MFEKFALPGYEAESLDEWNPTFRQNGSGVLLTLEDDAHIFLPTVSIHTAETLKMKAKFSFETSRTAYSGLRVTFPRL